MPLGFYIVAEVSQIDKTLLPIITKPLQQLVSDVRMNVTLEGQPQKNHISFVVSAERTFIARLYVSSLLAWCGGGQLF